MKKIFTLIASVLFIVCATQVNAQSPRITFCEEATQASCPPCATLNPALIATVDANADKVIFLAYQVWWPGYDAMYLDNESDVDDRIGYYGINAAPNIVIGDSGPQSTSYLSQSLIDNNYAETAAFDVNVSAELVDGELQVTGSVVASGTATGDIKLRLILAEKLIEYADAPGGTNGETEYHHVMKKFIGGTSGISLASYLNAGDNYPINETLAISTVNVYNFDQLEVIAIVQSDDTKFVYQAAKDSDVDIILSFGDNGAAGAMTLPETVCSGSQDVSPVVKIQNTGNNTLTSCDIVYSINGGADQTYNWTGSLTPLAAEDVTLDAYTFTAMATNTVEATIANPNGMTDEDLTDNVTTGSFDGAPTSDTGISLIIQLDGYPEETGWRIEDSAGNEIAGTSFPTFGTNGEYAGLDDQIVTEFIPIPSLDCHTLIMHDSFGDAFYGTQWGQALDGYFILQDTQGILYQSELQEEWAQREDLFDVTSVTGINDIPGLNDVSVYPNPATDNVTVDFEIDTDSQISFELLNMIGERVYISDVNNYLGRNQVNISVTNFTQGMYMLNMIVDGQLSTTKISITK